MAAHLGERDTEMVCHPAQANTVPPSLIGYGDGRVHDAGGQAVGRAGFLFLAWPLCSITIFGPLVPSYHETATGARLARRGVAER